MSLDLSSLSKAHASLQRAIARAQSSPDDEELRDAVIQRFEYTYELSWKMLKRQIERDAATPESVDAMGFRELIREGAVRGLINDPEAWFEYREQRNITSHTYDAHKAAQVYQAALRFSDAAEALLAELRRRNPRT